MILHYKDLPQSLKVIDDAPKKIYTYGNRELLENPYSIAIVGSRHPSSYGKKLAREFSTILAKNGIMIISGFAMGIDTDAHWGAIHAGGKTIAVLGCGINMNYPKSNGKLKEEMIRNHLIISEYGFDRQPKGYHFPYRNRIISAISLGVLVIECQIKSGTMTTVNHALNQGKAIFAIPGNITSLLSEGPNYLIKSGAIPVTDAMDICDYYSLFLKRT